MDALVVVEHSWTELDGKRRKDAYHVHPSKDHFQRHHEPATIQADRYQPTGNRRKPCILGVVHWGDHCGVNLGRREYNLLRL
jgi:hypothetical protein